jgi:predicted MFS family arabinose efflux permease
LTVAVFAILFGVGAIGRFVSAAMLSRQTEVLHSVRTAGANADDVKPDRVTAAQKFVAALNIIRRPGTAGRLVLFLMAVQTAVHVSGPYFNPFMLKVLKMSWVDYMGLLSLGFIGKMMSLAWAGRFANRWGADRLLWVGSAGIVPISALWFFSQNIWYLAGVQILSGLVWGCYELAMLLQFFRQSPGEKRVTVLTMYNLGNSAAMVAGTFIGAWILNSLGRDHHAYVTVFVASGFFRFAALLALPGRRNAVRTTHSAVRGWIRTSAVEVVRSKSATAMAGGARAVAANNSGHPDDESVILVSGLVKEESSVSSRIIEGGSGGSRRREGQSTARLPARVNSVGMEELRPRE